jgi:pimeloyl-ACP methyl ester carboxylesterase
MLKVPISNEVFTRQLNAIMEFDRYDRLSEIKVSTLILHAKKDVLVPPENSSILAESMPDAEIVYLKNSAHGLVEETEMAFPVLLNFLVE